VTEIISNVKVKSNITRTVLILLVLFDQIVHFQTIFT
jgi:hypothetical protein